MADSGIREIQLSGKQLVFLFMASVVLIVSVFLLGVSVGRGVHGVQRRRGRGRGRSGDSADAAVPGTVNTPGA